MDAHVALKGGFSELRDRDRAEQAIGQAVAGLNPFTIRTTEPRVLTRGDRASIVLPLEESSALRALHGRLVAALALYATDDSPPDLPGAYMPHLTVVADIEIDGVE